MEYRNVKIEDTGISIDIPLLLMDSSEDLKSPENKQVVFKAIVHAAFMMDNSNLKSVPCFIINDLQYEIDRIGIEENLNEALDYYTELEEYELCISINNLKSKLC